jgi:RNA polymerase sigma factor (sigma-70 family)
VEQDGHRDDSALIQACLDGDEAAWKDLVTRYGRLVYSIPRRYGLSAADADDVFQNVFTSVYRHLPTLRDQTRLTAWLITITHHEAQRVGKHEPVSAELDETATDGNDPPLEQVQALERQHLVRQALEQMGSPCRELLTALFLDPDPISYEKLAARLGIPVGSIGPTRARCFKKLEAILLELGVDLD